MRVTEQGGTAWEGAGDGSQQWPQGLGEESLVLVPLSP